MENVILCSRREPRLKISFHRLHVCRKESQEESFRFKGTAKSWERWIELDIPLIVISLVDNNDKDFFTFDLEFLPKNLFNYVRLKHCPIPISDRIRDAFRLCLFRLFVFGFFFDLAERTKKNSHHKVAAFFAAAVRFFLHFSRPGDLNDEKEALNIL